MEFKPLRLSGQAEADALAKQKQAPVRDLLPLQVKELFLIRHLTPIADRSAVEQLPEYRPFADACAATAVFWYYPWLNTIFHTVGADDFYELKTNRNQDLFTHEEQRTLRNFTVAVLGLSVGSNIAFLLTQAGISNRIFLADPDTLDTTNLNRIFTGIQDLGVNKSWLASRKITEGNPYAEVVPMENGIDEARLETLLASEKIDCLIEEVDSLPVKISTRRLAMKYKVPVIMITDNGFRIILHMERYDLGYNQIFEKDPAYWDQKLKGDLDIQRVSQIIVEDVIGDMQQIDPKLVASGMRMFQRELVSWPQLGSTAMLGGVVITHALKKLALKESSELFVKKFISLDV